MWMFSFMLAESEREFVSNDDNNNQYVENDDGDDKSLVKDTKR